MTPVGTRKPPAYIAEETEMWLPGLGSNQGPQLQRLLCYHYTTGHWGGGQIAEFAVRSHHLFSPPRPFLVKGWHV